MTPTFEEAFAAHQAGDFVAAERGYLALRHLKNALHNLGLVYEATGHLEAAEEVFRDVLADYPDYAPSRFALAKIHLAGRRYAQGWPLYEARRETSELANPRAGYPEWLGEPLAGKRLVVVVEQGLGDQLMFARWAPVLAGLADQVTVACDPRTMARLYERCGFATFSRWRSDHALPAADYWVFAGSIPWRLDCAAPVEAAYIPPPASARPAPQGPPQGIGIMAGGNPANPIDRWRSLSGADARGLLALGRDLSPAATGARDMLETAQIIDGLDLVISVETSVAHLALSMGKPCWVLLPRIAMDWRWNDGVRSDWYPQARLFRQAKAGTWADVLGELRQALRAPLR